MARTAYDIQLANLEEDLRIREDRYAEHPTKANLRGILAIKREIRELKGYQRNPMRRKRRRSRRNPLMNPLPNPLVGDATSFLLGGLVGIFGYVLYQTWAAQPSSTGLATSGTTA